VLTGKKECSEEEEEGGEGLLIRSGFEGRIFGRCPCQANWNQPGGEGNFRLQSDLEKKPFNGRRNVGVGESGERGGS